MIQSFHRKTAAWLVLCGALGSGPAWADALSGFTERGWTGKFGDQKIGLFVQRLTPTAIEGYCWVGQNRRPFQGTVRQEGGVYQVIAREPMTLRSDGEFRLRLDPATPQRLTGSWHPGHPSGVARTFRLVPRSCEAGAQVGEYPASQRLLTGTELQATAFELALMRNEIYARHGYAFANRMFAVYFADQDWYIPCSNNVSSRLSVIEKKNLDRLRKAEKYAAQGDWGR